MFIDFQVLQLRNAIFFARYEPKSAMNATSRQIHLHCQKPQHRAKPKMMIFQEGLRNVTAFEISSQRSQTRLLSMQYVGQPYPVYTLDSSTHFIPTVHITI